MLPGAWADNVTAKRAFDQACLDSRYSPLPMVPRFLIPAVVAALAAGLIAGIVMRARRRRAARIPELNRHPERLEQMLDQTDDA